MSHDATRPRGLLATWTAATFRPGELFAKPREKRSGIGPVAFAALVGLCAEVGAVLIEGMLRPRSAPAHVGRLAAAIVVGPLG